MKKLLLVFASILYLASCSEDDSNNSNTQATQEVSFGMNQKNISGNKKHKK